MGNNLEEDMYLAKRSCYIVLSLIPIIATIIYIYMMNYALDTLGILDERKWRSITIYLTGMGLFAVLFLALNVLVFLIGFLLKKNCKAARLIAQICSLNMTKKAQLAVVIPLSVIGSGLLLHYVLYQQKHDIGFNEGCFCLPNAIWIFAIACLAFWIINMIKRKTDVSDVEKYIVFAITIAIVFAMTFIINPFAFSDGKNGYASQFINFNIVWESIFNIVDGVPYTYDTTPIYGHYALFFLPVRYVDKRYIIIAISFGFSILIAIGQIATLYIINSFSKKNWVAVLLALGSVARTQYYDVHQVPIRTLFPILLSALFTYLYKREIKLISSNKWYVLFGVLLTLSIICNLEIGVVCILSFASYVIFGLLYYKSSIKEWIVNLIFLGITSLSVIVAAIGIVNIYNLINDGPIMLRGFFFPMTGTDTSIVEYIQDNCMWPVPLSNTAWIYILFFLLVGISAVWYVSTSYEITKRIYDEIPLLGALICMVIFSFAYYMNEPLWNDLAIYTEVLFCIIAVVINRLYFVLESNCQQIGYQFVRVAVILILVGSICGAVQVINDPVRIAGRELAKAYNSDKLNSQISEIDIPDSTYGFGQGVSMIYHTLGWENHMKYRDTSELEIPRTETFEVAVDDLKQKDYVFMGNSSNFDLELFNKLQERGFSFVLQKTFQVGAYEYCYYQVIWSE